MRSIHVTEYYSATERSDVLTPALLNVMLSGRSETPKATDSAGFRLLMSRDTNPQAQKIGNEERLMGTRLLFWSEECSGIRQLVMVTLVHEKTKNHHVGWRL